MFWNATTMWMGMLVVTKWLVICYYLEGCSTPPGCTWNLNLLSTVQFVHLVGFRYKIPIQFWTKPRAVSAAKQKCSSICLSHSELWTLLITPFVHVRNVFMVFRFGTVFLRIVHHNSYTRLIIQNECLMCSQRHLSSIRLMWTLNLVED